MPNPIPDFLLQEWHPTKNTHLNPADLTAGSKQRVWWLGKCNHEWDAVIHLRGAGQNCPYCAGKRILIGFNDLATTHPELAQEWHPTKNQTTTPQKISKGSVKKIWWQCSQEHEWEVSPNLPLPRMPLLLRKKKNSWC